VTSMMKTTDAKYQLQFDTFMSHTSFIYEALGKECHCEIIQIQHSSNYNAKIARFKILI